MFKDTDFIKAVRMESPSAIPTTVGFLPAMWIHHGKEAERLVKEYSQFSQKDIQWIIVTRLQLPAAPIRWESMWMSGAVSGPM